MDIQHLISTIKSVENPDPIRRLNGWHNYRLDKYCPGPIALANPVTDLFPQEQQLFKLHEQLQTALGLTPLRAAVIVMAEYRDAPREYEPRMTSFEYNRDFQRGPDWFAEVDAWYEKYKADPPEKSK